MDITKKKVKMSKNIRLISGYLRTLLMISSIEAKKLSYGFIESIVEIHAFVTNQHWYYGEQTFGLVGYRNTSLRENIYCRTGSKILCLF